MLTMATSAQRPGQVLSHEEMISDTMGSYHVFPDGNTYHYLVPTGLSFAHLLLQGLALNAASSNGFAAFTDGHEIVLIP